MHQIAVLITQHLDLDMARAGQPALEKDRAVAKGGSGLAPCAGNRLVKTRWRLDDPHAAPAAARRRLDQHRIADALRRRCRIGAFGEFVGVEGGHAHGLHQALGGQLVADAANRGRRGADPDQTGIDDCLRKAGVLGQKAIAGMHRIGAAAPTGVNHLADIEIGLRRGAAIECDRGIGFAHEGACGIAIGIDRDRADAHAMCGAHHAPGNLAAVGDQQSTDWLDDRLSFYIRHVPYSLVPATARL